MKKNLLLLFLSTLFCFSAIAQPKWGKPKGPSIVGKITGKLVDSLTGEAVSYATVELLDPSGQKQIDGTITSDNGKFKLEKVAPGTYTLRISFIGYADKLIRGLQLTPGKPDKNLSTVRLSTGSINLDEVVVTEEASIIENRVDKIVYNAEKDVSIAGGNASDVLRKVPLLSVDLEGNVSLRGSSNLRILINGKPSGIFANSVADALKSIPAEQIKNVEVITTPSAKYDGEGSAGIVNIITKKKSVQGYTGSISGSVGTRQNNGVVNMSYAKGRFGLNASASSWYSWPRDGTLDFERRSTINDTTTIVLDQNGITETSRVGFNGTIGAYYDINAYNSLSSSIRINGFAFDTDGNTNVFNNINGLLNEYTRNNIAQSLNSGYDWTTDYRRTFKEPQQEFSMALQLSGNISNRDNERDQISGGNILFDELSKNNGNNLELTFQSDYVHPFSKAVKLEVGGKTVIRRIDSDYDVRMRELPGENYLVDLGRTNVFNYEQDVYAGYTSFTFNIAKKNSLIAGVRYEHTSISGDFDTDFDSFSNEYDTWLPSFIFSRKLKNFQTIKFSYSRRIQRPSLFFINPYTDDNDRLNVTEGNPQLTPELANQFEVSYNTFVKGTVLNAAVYYKETNDVISQTTRQEGNTTVNTFQNVGQDNSIGINIFSSTTIKKIWQIRGNFNVFTYNIEGTVNGESLSNDGVLFGGFISNTFSFKKGFKTEFSWFGRSPRRTIQGKVPAFDMFSLGLKKEIFQKRGTVGLTIIEPFRRNKSFVTELEGSGFYQRSAFTLPFRSFGINFSYRFGKLDFKEKKRRSRIKNDDLKSGGDNRQG